MARAFLVVSLASLAGCTAGDEVVDSVVTKAEAAGLAGKDDARDWCADYAWYGDGECDTFCAQPDPDCGGPRLCAAIRGNGTWIFSHFGSLSRIVEEYGEIDGLAGGSSASITSFLYESMTLSPSIESQAPSVRRERLALMLKSLIGYTNLLGESEDAQALVAASNLAQDITTATSSPVGTIELAARLEAVLSKPEYHALVNPRVLEMLQYDDSVDAVSYERNVHEIVRAAQTVKDFSAFADDASIFFREGLVSFAGLAPLLARIGEFYSGAEPQTAARVETFLERCGPVSAGKTWRELATGEPERCAEPLADAFRTYHDALEQGFTPAARDRRLDHLVGHNVRAFIATAFLENTHGGLDALAASADRYHRGEPVDFHPDFRDVRFGYFVPPAYVGIDDAVRARYPEDAKAAKASVLNDERGVTWRTVLTYSPMEPGLSAIIPVDEDGDGITDRGFIGGWADLHPVQMLRAAECDEVVYVTRAGAESGFITLPRSLAGVPDDERSGVAELLGLTPEDQTRLYDVNDPNSSFSRAIEESTAVWCTDWNSANDGEFDYMFGQAYGSIASRDMLFDGSSNPLAGYRTSLVLNAGQTLGDGGTGAIPAIMTAIAGCRR